MIIIDKPYVSAFLTETLKEFQFPVLRSPDAVTMLPKETINFIDEAEAIRRIKNHEIKTVYTSSENSIGWVAKNLGFTKLPETVNIFKDKVKFRKLISGMYPDFFYKEVSLENLNSLNYEDLPKPFIIKPAIGFFSLGVYKVFSKEQWLQVKDTIQSEIQIMKDSYPQEVLDTKQFIIEENIEGEEYTIDAFFDEEGHPGIMGMMHHHFADPQDASDRLYTTSTKVISENLERFTGFLNHLTTLVSLHNFQMHIEVRVDSNGRIIPIEVNPLRFGGWCTSAELTHYAFGFNPYQYLMQNKIPNWKEILENHSDENYSVVILNNNSGIDAQKIKTFNYEKMMAMLEHPLELRKTDVVKYHTFGFVYAKTSANNFKEMEYLLHSELREFIVEV